MLDDAHRLQRLLDELSVLTTEAVVTERGDLDLLDTIDLVRRMNAEDQLVAPAVAERAEQIAQAVDEIADRFRAGGRLIYIGAGTPGRIGILDASECPPTFGTDPSMVVGIIAGDDSAIRTAVENAEDDEEAAVRSLRALGIGASDTVVGISASGRTPYVVAGLRYARSLDALTIAISANERSPIGAAAEIGIEVVTGPEFVSGSTRLKAGTAQKLVVNMLTTLAMIKLGKTYRGVMVDLVATNEKLRVRSVRTVIELTGATPEAAQAALREADGSTKVALLMIIASVDVSVATRTLDDTGGMLREAMAVLK